MSKGPGWLQREIMATLEEAKRTPWHRYGNMTYRGTGCEQQPGRAWRWDQPGWVWSQKACVRLAEGIYDLRASAAFLARTHQQMDYNAIKGVWTAAFSRAVRGLVQRKQLTPLWLVPIAEVDEDSHAEDHLHHLADGVYLSVHSRQLRFVSR